MNPEHSQWTAARVVGVLRRFWALIVAATVIGGGIGVAVSASTTPIFQSTASLYFALNQGSSASDLNQGSAYTQNQMLSFAQLATSSRVLDPVIDELDLDTTPRVLARSVAVSIPQSTVVLEVQVSSADPEEAADIANAVTASLVEVVRDIAPTGADSQPTVDAAVIDEAVVPRVQALPNTLLYTAIGLMIGLFAGLLAALAISIADNRVRSVEILAEVTDHPVLGTVSRAGGRKGRLTAVEQDPLSTRAEEFRRLRSALAYASLNDRLRRLVVTSSLPGDGKTTVATNLASAFSDPDTDVLLVDADLRKPRVSEYLGIEGSVGLTSVLLGSTPLETAALGWGASGLVVLPSGATPPNPAEVITSLAMRTLLESPSITERDLVVLDSPPVLSVADASLLGPLVDGVLIVVDARRTRRSQVVQAIRDLESSGSRIVGLVLNNVKASKASRSAYYQDVSRSDD